MQTDLVGQHVQLPPAAGTTTPQQGLIRAAWTGSDNHLYLSVESLGTNALQTMLSDGVVLAPSGRFPGR